MLLRIFLFIEWAWGQFFWFLRRKFGRKQTVFAYPYRGYGNQQKVRLEGRVLEKVSRIHETGYRRESSWANFRLAWKRYFSHEIPGAKLRATFQGHTLEAVSDREGYFTFVFEGDYTNLSGGWHEILIELVTVPHHLDYEPHAIGEIFLVDSKAAFGIISDMDDTVMQSNVVRKLKMLTTMLFNSAESRMPFEGVADLYQGLHQNGKNPIFFLSGSSYNLYDLLVKFCHAHQIPKAPLLLRDMGISKDYWFLQRTREFKREGIEHLLEMFPGLPFILSGDSGQHDPEIYLDIQKKHPDRILGIYIRHVPLLKLRDQDAEKMKKRHPDFITIQNTSEAVRHATSKGWLQKRDSV